MTCKTKCKSISAVTLPIWSTYKHYFVINYIKIEIKHNGNTKLQSSGNIMKTNRLCLGNEESKTDLIESPLFD